jgi:hypothetical protein
VCPAGHTKEKAELMLGFFDMLDFLQGIKLLKEYVY